MRFFMLFLLVLEAIPLAITVPPVGLPEQQQQPLPISPPSSVNSFTTLSDVESSSDPGRTFGKLGVLNAFKKLKASSEFRCHSYPETNILSELSSVITTLVRSYRDTIFDVNEDQQRKLFETCYAGYDANEVSPTIYFRGMKSKQINKVQQLLRNQVLTVFPNVKIVKTTNSFAVVVEERAELKRRNTI